MGAPHLELKQEIQAAIAKYEEATGYEVYEVKTFYDSSIAEFDIEIEEDTMED